MGRMLSGLTSPTGRDAMLTIGGLLKDLGGGENGLATAQQLMAQRRKDAEDTEQRGIRARYLAGLAPEERAEAELDPVGHASNRRVTGMVLRKIAHGETLSPGEEAIKAGWSRRPAGDNSAAGLGTAKGDEAALFASPAVGADAPIAPNSAATETPPERVLDQLVEGEATAFANGQVWTLSGGRPVRVQ
jgi:hypothetical protein